MKVSASWLVVFGLAAGAALLLSLYQLLGWTGPVMFLAFVFSVAVTYLLWRLLFVHLNEMEFGVVFKRNGNFSRFLDSGRHFINPFTERFDSRITKKSQDAKATTKVRTREGILVSVAWRVSFKVNIHNVKKEIQFKLARSLPKAADKLVGGKTVQSLRHIVEQKSVLNLYRLDASKELEEQLCAQLNARLELRHKQTYSHNGVVPVPDREADKPIQGLGFDPVPWYDVQILSIEMPPEVERALKIDHQRRLETTTTTNALARLRAVIRQFSDSDMKRLAELERLRILDKDGQSLTHLMATLS